MEKSRPRIRCGTENLQGSWIDFSHVDWIKQMNIFGCGILAASSRRTFWNNEIEDLLFLNSTKGVVWWGGQYQFQRVAGLTCCHYASSLVWGWGGKQQWLVWLPAVLIDPSSTEMLRGCMCMDKTRLKKTLMKTLQQALYDPQCLYLGTFDLSINR